jgi:hypothetical protein
MALLRLKSFKRAKSSLWIFSDIALLAASHTKLYDSHSDIHGANSDIIIRNFIHEYSVIDRPDSKPDTILSI